MLREAFYGAQPGLLQRDQLFHSVLSVNPCKWRGRRAQNFKRHKVFLFSVGGGTLPQKTGGGGTLTQKLSV